MRRMPPTLVLVVALFALSLLAPRAGAVHGLRREPPSTEATTTEARLIEILRRSADDWNAGDLDGFIAPYDASATFMTPAGPIDRAAMRERYTRNYFAAGRPAERLTFDQVHVRMLGAGHALMTGRYLLSGGGKPDATGRFTLVWRRGSEGWKIVHDHTS